MANPMSREMNNSPAVWGAVETMALTVSVLISTKFLPVSLLTHIARDLSLMEGQAGQAISISGLFAVITSLFIAQITAGIRRIRPNDANQ